MAERADLPLFVWGETRRATRDRRVRMRRLGVIAASGIALIGATMVTKPAPRLVWNASASAPVGLYGVTPGARVGQGDMVIARLAEPMRTLAASRRYLPANVLLVKRVAALPGATVCARGRAIWIDGRRVATRRRRDGAGRPMPWWTGCRRLAPGFVFLLMPHVPGSFDGRYFGPTRVSDIVGKARLLWAR